MLALGRGKHFLVGTVRHQIGEVEPSHGRLLLFSFDVGQTAAIGERGRALELNLTTMQEAEGCVYVLVEVDGAVAAAVNTSVSSSLSAGEGAKLTRGVGRLVPHRRRPGSSGYHDDKETGARGKVEPQLLRDQPCGSG